MRKHSLLKLTAYHEAGHAVALAALGVPFSKVSIQRQGESAGRVSVPPLFTAVFCDNADTIECRIMCLLAGPAAEARLTGRTNWFAGGVDLKQAVTIAAHHPHLDSSEIEPYLSFVWARANTLIQRYWRSVELVAAQLLILTELSQEEVRKIVLMALPAKKVVPEWRFAKDPTQQNPELMAAIQRSLTAVS